MERSKDLTDSELGFENISFELWVDNNEAYLGQASITSKPLRLKDKMLLSENESSIPLFVDAVHELGISEMWNGAMK